MRISDSYLSSFIAFVALSVYYPALFSPFNSVDDVKMVNILLNTDDFRIRDIFFPGGSGYYYRPILSLTFIFDRYIWGLQESFMHLENMALHAVNSVLIFFIASKIFSLYNHANKALPLSAALLFALHPVNTEPVNWISGRTDVLACTFLLLSLQMLLSSLRENKLLPRVLGSVFFLLACLTKEPAVFFFPAAMFIIYCYGYKQSCDAHLAKGTLYSERESRIIMRNPSSYIFFTLSIFCYFYMRYLAFPKIDTGISATTVGTISPETHILNKLRIVIKVFGFYIKKMFFPWPLNFAIIKVPDYYVALGIISIVLCLYLIYRRDLVGSLFIAGISVLIPALFLPLAGMTWTPVAERYLYIPSAFFSIAIVYIVHTFFVKTEFNKEIIVIVVLSFLVIAYSTFSRNLIWQSNLTLFQDTVEKTPDFPLVRNELAAALKGEGRIEEANSVILSNIVLTTDGTNEQRSLTELSRATVFSEKGDYESAKKILYQNLNSSGRLYNSYLEWLINVNNKMADKSDDAQEKRIINYEIIDLYKRLQKNTSDPFYYYRIAQKYLSAGDISEARNYFSLAYQKSSNNAYYKEPARKLAERLSTTEH